MSTQVPGIFDVQVIVCTIFQFLEHSCLIRCGLVSSQWYKDSQHRLAIYHVSLSTLFNSSKASDRFSGYWNYGRYHGTEFLETRFIDNRLYSSDRSSSTPIVNNTSTNQTTNTTDNLNPNSNVNLLSPLSKFIYAESIQIQPWPKSLNEKFDHLTQFKKIQSICINPNCKFNRKYYVAIDDFTHSCLGLVGNNLNTIKKFVFENNSNNVDHTMISMSNNGSVKYEDSLQRDTTKITRKNGAPEYGYLLFNVVIFQIPNLLKLKLVEMCLAMDLGCMSLMYNYLQEYQNDNNSTNDKKSDKMETFSSNKHVCNKLQMVELEDCLVTLSFWIFVAQTDVFSNLQVLSLNNTFMSDIDLVMVRGADYKHLIANIALKMVNLKEIYLRFDNNNSNNDNNSSRYSHDKKTVFERKQSMFGFIIKLLEELSTIKESKLERIHLDTVTLRALKTDATNFGDEKMKENLFKSDLVFKKWNISTNERKHNKVKSKFCCFPNLRFLAIDVSGSVDWYTHNIVSNMIIQSHEKNIATSGDDDAKDENKSEIESSVSSKNGSTSGELFSSLQEIVIANRTKNEQNGKSDMPDLVSSSKFNLNKFLSEIIGKNVNFVNDLRYLRVDQCYECMGMDDLLNTIETITSFIIKYTTINNTSNKEKLHVDLTLTTIITEDVTQTGKFIHQCHKLMTKLFDWFDRGIINVCIQFKGNVADDKKQKKEKEQGKEKKITSDGKWMKMNAKWFQKHIINIMYALFLSNEKQSVKEIKKSKQETFSKYHNSKDHRLFVESFAKDKFRFLAVHIRSEHQYQR